MMADIETRVEDTETGHVRRRGLDELLVRGAAAVPVHAPAATAAAGERNENERRRNDADPPQDGRIIGGEGERRHHPFRCRYVAIVTTRR